MSGPEAEIVENPFLDQLSSMGWSVVVGSLDHPSVSGRTHFLEVLLKSDLAKALHKINLRDGKPWLDPTRIAQAIAALEHIPHPRLMEANQAATKLLDEGVTVDGLPDWDQGRGKTIRFIDWDNPENNAFLAISQFKVECPGGMSKGSIRPDITLFINGIPVVVIECKSPTISEPIADAINQLRRYHNARKESGEVDEAEGAERLFHTNQFLIATSFDKARVGTIGAQAEHYLEWKDTAPVPLAQVATELNRKTLSSQNKLIAGMLRPAHLIDIIRHFTLYQQVAGRTVKIVCRYQQFRAVHSAIVRLCTGKTKAEDGEHDRRGGLIWHTQGSGKSLTMVFLVRKMRSVAALRKFKNVLVTDRKDLQRQLSKTAALTGETVRIGKTVKQVKAHLQRQGPEIVFVMIQKYLDRKPEKLGAGDEVGKFGVLNDSEAILVMVDEAHRSHSNALHASLHQSLPNCARIGFTGTPIIMGAKKRTTEIFGAFIDRYTIKESEADEATVPILYEGRFAKGAVSDASGLDEALAVMFPEFSDEQREALKRKHGTLHAILEAEEVIADKADDILRHYVAHILPNGLKAQLVAVSRRAAVRYQAALVEAQARLVAAAQELDAATRALDDLELVGKPKQLCAAVRAARQLDRLRALEFAAVISADNNENPEWTEWTDGGKIESRIEKFMLPFEHEDAEKRSPLAFLIVKSMLLTGFDAPIEGVMYLDRPIREAELLQAIARVNRTGHGKTAGIVVDYYGIAKHLKDALTEYSAEDIDGALRSLADEIPKLRDRHARVVALFTAQGVDPMEDVDGAIAVLRDERLRAEFSVKLKQFLAILDLVLPRPEALPFVKAATVFGEIHIRGVRNLYRDGLGPLDKQIGHKVQALIDEHIISLGIDPRIPPISITDPRFAEQVSRKPSPRARATDMEHAARQHIKKKLDEDPVYYQRLSERLEDILHKFGDNWEQLEIILRDFVEEARKGRTQVETPAGLDPEIHAPFFDILAEERAKLGPVTQKDRVWLTTLTIEMVERLIRDAVSNVGFWRSDARQEELCGQLFVFLDENGIVEFDDADAVAARLMELAKANQGKLARAPTRSP